MTHPPQNNNPYPVPGPNGEPVQPAPVASGYQAPAANGYQAPNVNGMPSYPGQQGFVPAPVVSPDAEEKLKRSQIVLLATAGAYLMASIFALFPVLHLVQGDMVVGVLIGPAIQALVVLGLFTLVYMLIAQHKNAGRITGYVFAGLGILSAFTSALMSLFISPILIIPYFIWLGLGVTWIILVSNKSVSSILR